MAILPNPDVTAVVLEDGCLELHSQHSESPIRCAPVNTAMWIAIRQHDGRLDAAADLLAGLWDVDPGTMRSDLDLWVNELGDAGLVHDAP
ncbi:PqqD family protein [Streptomyces sp. AC512_CC834]|uniref:PqqD family protein n=1 Tax=Streptomyces sp. AC512_CC834 TaxID=2823691 RepID=UPI001C2722B8|nr:PqqD family protein [Streptomyces sp. AC512_CC834]